MISWKQLVPELLFFWILLMQLTLNFIMFMIATTDWIIWVFLLNQLYRFFVCLSNSLTFHDQTKKTLKEKNCYFRFVNRIWIYNQNVLNTRTTFYLLEMTKRITGMQNQQLDRLVLKHYFQLIWINLYFSSTLCLSNKKHFSFIFLVPKLSVANEVDNAELVTIWEGLKVEKVVSEMNPLLAFLENLVNFLNVLAGVQLCEVICPLKLLFIFRALLLFVDRRSPDKVEIHLVGVKLFGEVLNVALWLFQQGTYLYSLFLLDAWERVDLVPDLQFDGAVSIIDTYCKVRGHKDPFVVHLDLDEDSVQICVGLVQFNNLEQVLKC